MRAGKPLLVGLTGGIGSGKSEALSAFREAGAETISLDAVAHELSRPGRPVYRAILRTFGREVLRPDGGIDRRALAERVFSKPGLRRRLEAASHPPILREMRRRLKGVRRPVAVVDVPLLFEAGLEGGFDVTVAVSASREARLSRVRRRDGMSRAAVLRRMRAQRPLAEKERMADVVIRNEGSLKTLRRTVAEYQMAFDLMASSLKAVKRARPLTGTLK